MPKSLIIILKCLANSDFKPTDHEPSSGRQSQRRRRKTIYSLPLRWEVRTPKMLVYFPISNPFPLLFPLLGADIGRSIVGGIGFSDQYPEISEPTVT